MSANRKREHKPTRVIVSTSTSKNRRQADMRVKAVRSAVDFYNQAMKRSDIRGIMEDLSKL